MPACTDAAGESPWGQTPASTGPAPSGLGYRPMRVRIRTAVARIVGAVAVNATHQILCFLLS